VKPHGERLQQCDAAASRDDRLKLYDGGRGNRSLYIEEKISRTTKNVKNKHAKEARDSNKKSVCVAIFLYVDHYGVLSKSIQSVHACVCSQNLEDFNNMTRDRTPADKTYFAFLLFGFFFLHAFV